MDFEKQRRILVDQLIREGRIETEIVKNAFLETPRELFIPEKVKNQAYSDTPLLIGNGQTISAPHMVAIMCEGLDLRKGQKILEIGTGSGYHAAIISKIIGKEGKIFSIERYQDLAQRAENNLEKANIENVIVILGDGSKGSKEYAPYDRIYVTCGAPTIPQPLLEQLNENGKLMIPIGGRICQLKLIEKQKGKIKEKNLGGCAFVPLIGKYGF